MPLRVHQDIVLTSQMLVPGDDVILLPVATRYEQEGGGTETTTERRIVFSPEIPPAGRRGPQRVAAVRRRGRAGAARAAPRASTGPTTRRCAPRSPRSCRSTPASSTSRDTGDAVQWGGRHLCAGGVFPTPTGRAAFTSARAARAATCPTGAFTVATRRGKQFNSMVLAETDPLTGAARDAVYIDEADAAALGLADGDRGRAASAVGRVRRPGEAGAPRRTAPCRCTGPRATC